MRPCLRHPIVFVAALAALGATHKLHGFYLYEPSLLGWGSPHAMNEQGDVVGGGQAGEWGSTPVLWDGQTGKAQAVVPGTRGFAVDINEGGALLAGLWEGGSGYVLATQGATESVPVSSASALNNLLQVVGSGGIWEAGETRSIDGVEGFDINDRGQVAGRKNSGAVIWENGEFIAVGPPGSYGSTAYGINELGQAAGTAKMPNRHTHAFFWDGSSSADLGSLGGWHALANAINDLVQIVGWSYTDGVYDSRAFLWEDGAMADLNDLLTEPFPYTLVEAVDINNRGQIACRAVDASGGSWAVLLSPIPEPGAWLLLAAGAAAALRRRRAAMR